MARPVEQVAGEQMAALRREQGLSQGVLAEMVRFRGLRWNRNTVAQVETGRRQLSAVELLAVASVFSVSPWVLLAGAETEVMVGDATWSAGYVRAVVADGGGRVPVPASFTSPERVAREQWRDKAVDEHRARLARLSERWGLEGSTVGLFDNITASAGEAEAAAARRLRARDPLDVDERDVVIAAAHRWGHSLLDERERRVAELAPEPGSLRAIRGQITRQLDAELLDELDKTPLPPNEARGGEGFWGQYPEDPAWLVEYLNKKGK